MKYSLKLLEQRHAQENKDLAMWEDVVEKSDDGSAAKRQALGSIPSTNTRIEDLEEAILFLSLKVEEQKLAQRIEQGKEKKS